MTKEQRFNKLTSTMMSNQRERYRVFTKNRAACVPYELEELRVFVRSFLGRPCRYCCDNLRITNASLDHEIPLTRAKDFCIVDPAEVFRLAGNYAVICKRCNRRKGDLTYHEFRQLVDFVSLMHTSASRYIMRKLSARLPFYKQKKAA